MLNSMSLTIHLDNIQKIEPEIDCLNRFSKIAYDNHKRFHKETSNKSYNEQSQYLLREYSTDFDDNYLDNSLGDFLYSF